MKLKNKLKSLNTVATKLFLTQIIIAICALLANVLSARTLGPEARGQLGLYMQIAYVANAFCVLGRHRSYLKQQSKFPQTLETTFADIRNLSRAPFLFSILIGIACGFILGSEPSSIALLSLGFISLIYSGVQQKNYRSAAIIANNANSYFWSSFIGQILTLAILGLLTIVDNDSLSIWLLTYGLSVVLPYTMLSLFLLLKAMPQKTSNTSLVKTKKLGLKLVPMSVTEIIGSRMDRFLIPALANFAQLGVYTVVVTMTELIAWPVKNYSDAKVPKWSKEISTGKFQVLKEVTILLFSIVLLSLLVGLFLEFSLVIIFGSEYLSGKVLIWPLVFAAGLHAWNHFGTNICLAAGFNFLASSIPITATAFSVFSYLLLIPRYGALGASWGLVLGYFAAGILSIIGIARVRKAHRVYFSDSSVSA